jgi:transposase
MGNQKKRQLSFITYEAYKKIKKDDPIKILFESIDWSFISHLIKDAYPVNRELVYDPIALFKSQLLIWLGEVESNRKLAKTLQFNSRFCVLCGFDNFLKTPAHSTFSYFRKRVGKDAYFKILQRLIAQLAVIAIQHKISISSNRLHIVVYSDDGGKSCNCSGSKCRYNQKHSKLHEKLKTHIKHFVVNDFKVKMIIDSVSQLPAEAILSPSTKG